MVDLDGMAKTDGNDAPQHRHVYMGWRLVLKVSPQ